MYLEVFIKRLCKAITAYKSIVFKSRFVKQQQVYCLVVLTLKMYCLVILSQTNKSEPVRSKRSVRIFFTINDGINLLSFSGKGYQK